MVTFKLTIPEFQRLLDVLLAPDAPDRLSNLVLMACTRPHDGIISVPVPAEDASAIRQLVAASAQADPFHVDLASLISRQVDEAG